VRVNPQDPIAHVSLGNAFLDKKDFDAAIREYEEAIRLRFEYPNAHYNLALAYESAGKIGSARVEYGLYLQQAPNAPDAEQIRTHVKRLNKN